LIAGSAFLSNGNRQEKRRPKEPVHWETVRIGRSRGRIVVIPSRKSYSRGGGGIVKDLSMLRGENINSP
jgi:hypothetical protein